MKASLQTLTLLGVGVWVHHNKIGGLGVQSSSSKSVPSIGHVLPYSGGDSRSFDFSFFPVNLGVVVLEPVIA